MKKFIVLLVALCVASTAFAADFNWSFDLGASWNGNLDDIYGETLDELELGLSVDVDEYNTFSTEFQAEASGATGFENVMYDEWKLVTDLGAAFGLPVGITWTNGFGDPGASEYSDFTAVGYETNGLSPDLEEAHYTVVKVDLGMVYAAVASQWDYAAANESVPSQVLMTAGSTSLVPGLSVEGAYLMSSPSSGKNDSFSADVTYAYDMAPMMITAGGSFLADLDAEDTSSSKGNEQKFGAGVKVKYAVDETVSVTPGVSFKGNNDTAFDMLGFDVALDAGMYGANFAMGYDMDPSDKAPKDEDIDFADTRVYVKVGALKVSLGYIVNDKDGVDEYLVGGVAQKGKDAVYMNFECDF